RHLRRDVRRAAARDARQHLARAARRLPDDDRRPRHVDARAQDARPGDAAGHGHRVREPHGPRPRRARGVLRAAAAVVLRRVRAMLSSVVLMRPGPFIAITVAVSSLAAVARADGPYEGQWNAGAMHTDVAIHSWGADCGPRPQSTTSGGGGTVNVTQ